MTVVATNARQRVYGLTPEQSRHQDAGTVLGRLWLCGAITRNQFEAGEKFRGKHAHAMRAIKAPIPLAVTNHAGDGGDLITDEYIEWAIAAVAEYEVLKTALRTVRALGTVELVVICDDEPTELMLWALRDGLDVLVKRL